MEGHYWAVLNEGFIAILGKFDGPITVETMFYGVSNNFPN